jgi:excisionase family DNA binding protein
MALSNLGYLTTAEVAEILGFTPDHVRRMILDGKIKAVKLGNNLLIKPKDIKDIKRLRKSPLKETV